MENSIENIWKKGFTNESTSIPKIENLDSLRSIYFVDTFKRRYQTNIVILLLTAVVVLFAFVMGGIPFIGIFMFILFATLAFLGKRELDKFNRLDKGSSNYEYVKALDDWLKGLLTQFSFIYKIWIPLFFIGFALAILHTNFFVPFIGETLIERLVDSSNTFTLMGLPVYLILVLLAVAIILYFVSDYLFKKEIRSVYGDLIARLDVLLRDLDELR